MQIEEEKLNTLFELGLCDRCLGRQVFRAVKGENNTKRGHKLREERGLPPVPENECLVCGGLFTELNTFVKLILNALRDYEFDTFLIGSVIEQDIVEKEKELQERLGLSKVSETLKGELNREIGLRVYSALQKEVSFEKPDIVAVIDTRYDTVSLQIAPLFIYGRYQKFDRTIPQTIWNCKRCRGKGCEYCNYTGKMYPTSVQELIGDVFLKETEGTKHTFHGMGREDIDARMLGNGRPFILEISNPKKRVLNLSRMMDRVNNSASGRVAVMDLRYARREDVAKIKSAKAEKTYLAEVEFEKPVDPERLKEVEKELTGRVILQRTPNRVSHRRADIERERKVININSKVPDEQHAAFTIRGESGLYIKELIHGDEGRTQPSISEILGIKCRVISLDVLSVHYDENLSMGR